MDPEDRRVAIVDAAVKVMLRNGMAATTVRAVAQEMGTSSGLIHHYFLSMDQMLAAAFDRAATEDLRATRAAMAARDGPVARLGAFFSTYARAEQEWAFQIWLDAWSEAARRPEVRETSRRLNVAWQQLLVETVVAGVEQKAMTCEDPEAAGWRILSLLEGLVVQAVAHQLPIERQVLIEWAASHAENELGLTPGSVARACPR